MHARQFLGALAVAMVASAPALQAQSMADRAVHGTAAPVAGATRGAASVRQLEAGTTISLTLADTISSSKNQVGDVVPAVISRDVKDAEGRVIFPAGTEARVKIAAFQQPMPHRDDARILLQLKGATSNGQAYELESPAAAAVKAKLVGRRLMGVEASREFAVKGGEKVEFTLPQAMLVN